MTLFTPPHLLDGQRWRGLRVGLLGGSFNPPHAGHVHISKVALQYLNLDCVWWLVTPQNPLKQETANYPKRLAECQALTRNHPRIIVSDLEYHLKTNRTLDTLRGLKKRFAHTEFVFLAGTDIAAQLHHWHRWAALPDQVPMAFIARPPATGLVRNGRFKMLKTKNQVLGNAKKSALSPRETLWIFGEALHPESSSAIRKTMNIKGLS